MGEYRFRELKTFVAEEECVVNAIPESTRYKNKWAARIFEKWAKVRFSKVATLEPGGVFKEYDLHIVQSLKIPLFQMDAISVNYWLTKFVQEVAKPSKERYPPKTFYQIVCGLRRFMEEENEKTDFKLFISLVFLALAICRLRKFASVFEIVSNTAVFSTRFSLFLNPST